jgi:protein translocase SecG subunit
MNGILSILIILSALLLMLVVLVQSPKGGGLGSSFGSTPSMMGGVRRTTEFLDKLTWGFAGALLVFVLLDCLAAHAICLNILRLHRHLRVLARVTIDLSMKCCYTVKYPEELHVRSERAKF